jgi:mannose-6-phosphate isomerase-like protein (cupin superfamily)
MPSAEHFFHDFSHAIQVFNRTQLEALVEMEVEGERTYLGEVRNFKSLEYLKAHLPKDLSVSWSSLPQGQELKAHFHPCDSFLIITEGQGESFGDTQVPIEAGDIVYIPKGNLHGFRGLGAKGLQCPLCSVSRDSDFRIC